MYVKNAPRPVSTDREIVEQARRDAPAALATIYELHGPALFRLAARMLGSASEAEDVVHDLFVGLPELLRRYEHREALDGWLRAVVARMALGRLRRDRRRDELAARDAVGAARSTSIDPWNAVDLERAMVALAPDDRAVFALRQLEGYSHAEVAHFLDITEGAARVRYARALERLRQLLEPGT